MASRRFGGGFAQLFARIHLERGFPVPADDELEPALEVQLREWCAKVPVALPLDVMHVFLSCCDPAVRDGLHGGLRAPGVHRGPGA